jgi:acyl-CoA thioesterase FadM
LEAEGLENHEDIPLYALSELTMKYVRPLQSQDMYVVTVATEECHRARVVFRQRVIRVDRNDEDLDKVCLKVLRENRCQRRWKQRTPCYMDTIPNLQVVVEALATVVLLDEKYRPMRVPDFFKHAVAKYQCHQ